MLVFASHDATEFDAACTLARAVGGRFVDRLSSELRDLQLVAKYKVVEPVCVVLVVGARVVARIPRLVDVAALREDIALCGHTVPGSGRGASGRLRGVASKRRER